MTCTHRRFWGVVLIPLLTLLTPAKVEAHEADPVAVIAAEVLQRHTRWEVVTAAVGPELTSLDEVLNRAPGRGDVPQWVADPVLADLARYEAELQSTVRRVTLEFRSRLADLARVLAPTQDLMGEWEMVEPERLDIVLRALSLHGIGYQQGAAGPGTYDCSGFTMVVLADSGVVVPHKAAWQQQSLPGTGGPYLPADLLFFAGGATAAGPLNIGHVGIYIGAGLLVHANAGDNAVAVDPVASVENFVAAAEPRGELG